MARRDLDQWLWQVGQELQRLSEEMQPGTPKVARSKAWEPRIDLVEANSHLILKAEIPGVRKEDIRIFYRGERNSLVLKGVRIEEDIPAECSGIHQLEIYYGAFEREVRLPGLELDFEKTSVEYHNGFLIVSIPKSGVKESEKLIVTRTITIQKI